MSITDDKIGVNNITHSMDKTPDIMDQNKGKGEGQTQRRRQRNGIENQYSQYNQYKQWLFV